MSELAHVHVCIQAYHTSGFNSQPNKGMKVNINFKVNTIIQCDHEGLHTQAAHSLVHEK